MDDIDRRIIDAVQGDGRITINDLATRVGLSPSPCARRIRLLEESGVIKGYTAIIDQRKVGLPISAFASIKLERQREEDLDRFAKAVAIWPEVVDCYLMTGQRDYLLRIVVRDLEAYEGFLKNKLPPRRCRLHRDQLRPGTSQALAGASLALTAVTPTRASTASITERSSSRRSEPRLDRRRRDLIL